MEKEKKKISCSYALLVVILFATVCFLVDYIVIDRKLNENKGGSSTDSNVSENANSGSSNVSDTSGVQYTYDNIAGKYSAVVPGLIEESNEYLDSHYMLYLYNDGTYEYSYGSSRTGFGEAGNYIIKDNMLVLNRSFVIGSNGGIMTTSFEKSIITMDNLESISGTFNNLTGDSKGKREVTLKKDVSYDDSDSENSSYKKLLNHFTLYNESNYDELQR